MATEPTEKIKKKEIIQKFALKVGDTGSPEVQVALLTSRITKLTKHFEKHREDRHSQRGMMRLISQRKGLLSYLKGVNPERYKSTISALGLRK